MAQTKQPDQSKTTKELERKEEEGAERRLPMRWGPYMGRPFSMMRRMMEDFERMFDEPLFGGGAMREAFSRGPAIDVFERGNDLVVHADVPGYDKKDIKLELTEDGLILEGERKEEREEDKGGFYRRERVSGSFRRMIPLPEGIDADKVRAEMKEGVLEICFPLPAQRNQRKKIEIGAGKEEDEPKSVH